MKMKMKIVRFSPLKMISLSLLFSFFLTACTTNPYTVQSQPSKTAVGVGLGAGSGAAIGQLIGHNTTATLIGAGVGAVVGGVAGSVMDRQADVLRKQLQGTGVSVARQGNDIQLIMPGDITFA